MLYASYSGVYVYRIPEQQAYPVQPGLTDRPRPPGAVCLWTLNFPDDSNLCARGLTSLFHLGSGIDRVVLCTTTSCYELSISRNASAGQEFSVSQVLSARFSWPTTPIFSMGIGKAIGCGSDIIILLQFSASIPALVVIPDPLLPDGANHPLLDEISGRFVLHARNTASIFDASACGSYLS